VPAVAQLEQLKKMRKEQMWSKSLKRMLLPHYCRRLSTHKLNVNSTPRCQRATTFIAVFRCHDGGDMSPLNPLLSPLHPNYILGSMCGLFALFSLFLSTGCSAAVETAGATRLLWLHCPSVSMSNYPTVWLSGSDAVAMIFEFINL